MGGAIALRMQHDSGVIFVAQLHAVKYEHSFRHRMTFPESHYRSTNQDFLFKFNLHLHVQEEKRFDLETQIT